MKKKVPPKKSSIVWFSHRWDRSLQSTNLATGTILSSTVAYIFEMGDDTKFTSIPVGAVGGFLPLIGEWMSEIPLFHQR